METKNWKNILGNSNEEINESQKDILVNNMIDARTDTERQMWIKEYQNKYPTEEAFVLKNLIIEKMDKRKSVEPEVSSIDNYGNNLVDISNNLLEKGEELVDNATKVSDKVNEQLFDKLEQSSEWLLNKTGKLVEVANEHIDKMYAAASGMQLEDLLSKKFDDNAFVEMVLKKKILFTVRFRDQYDFLKKVGTFNIFTSSHEIFKLYVLNTTNGKEIEFKINDINVNDHLDLIKAGVKPNVVRIYNAIAKGIDSSDAEANAKYK